jgi:uncharacterized protein
MNDKIPFRFFVVTFLWSWILWLPFVLVIPAGDTSLRSILLMPALFLGAFGPALAAFYSVWSLKGKAALREFLKSFLSMRFGWKVWLSIFIVLGCVNLTAWYIPELFGYDRLQMLLPTIYVFPIVWLFMVVLGGGQEEIGWRGYIMPILESRFGLWAGNIILGLVWSLWHIPLWFIPETNQVYMPFAAFVLGHIGLSFFLSWVIKTSGGKPLSGLIAHGTSNAFVAIFPTFVMSFNVIQWRFWIHEILILLVGFVFMISMKKKIYPKR